MYLAPDGSFVEYGSIPVEINKRIKQDLVLSADQASLYAMTQDKVGLGALEEWPGGRATVVSLEGCRQRPGGADPPLLGVLAASPSLFLEPPLSELCPWSLLRPTLVGAMGWSSEWASPKVGRAAGPSQPCELDQWGQPIRGLL